MRDSKIKPKIVDEYVTEPVFYNDGLGHRIPIKSPVLLSIFQSKELIASFREDPHKKYSARDIVTIRRKELPVKESTIRRALVDNTTYFETSKDVQVIGKKGNKTVKIINFTKLKPVVKNVFEAIEQAWEQKREERLEREKYK